MAFKCTNERCGYGPEWDEGLPVTKDASGLVPEHLRSDSYSQTPSFRNPDVSNFDGLCLNCHSDRDDYRVTDINSCHAAY